MTYTSVVSYEASNETREPGDSTNSGRASDGLLPPHIVVDPGGNSSVSKEAERYDVEFKLVVYDLGDGRYRCTLDATYLNMPDDKEWDGLGIAVQGCTFDGNASAWMKYDAVKSNIITGNVLEEYSLTYDMQTAIVADSGVSGWCGRGLKYELFEDWWHNSYTVTRYSNLRLHLEFECVVTYPTLETNFQVYVSYEHIYEELSYVPSFGFGMDGSVSYSYSYASETMKDRYVFSLDNAIHYIPE